MGNWNQTFSEICSGLEKHIYRNETMVSQSIVRRMISLLGWNVDNPEVVYPEYPCGDGGRADYALLDASGRPKVLIEVKAVGNISDDNTIANQLVRYAYGVGAGIIVLTDGQEWHFFYNASGSSSMQERRFYKIDILDRASEDVYEIMMKYIGHDATLSGESIQAAHEMYRSVSAKRKAQETLPAAFKHLIETKDATLARIISEKVADLSGVSPDDEAVFRYLGSLTVPSTPSTLPPRVQLPSAPVPHAPTYAQSFPAKKAKRSSFAMLNIPVGSILCATFDPAHQFRTVDNMNQIEDLRTGEVRPISNMAAHYLGGSKNGYEFFTYNGQKLSDIRAQQDKDYYINR